MNLGPEALRVLGALIEKDRTTPEYYPMSVNALVAASNQKTNRDPVLELDEPAVERALEELRGAGLAVRAAGSGRVVKHSHNLIGRLQVDAVELCLLAELMLRGPQTSGELRGRVERMHHLDGIAEVEEALARLLERQPPLVERLPRQPGQKESRFRQLLGGSAPETAPMTAPALRSPGAASPSSPSATAEVPAGDVDERVRRLEAEVAALRGEVAALWREFRSLTLQPE